MATASPMPMIVFGHLARGDARFRFCWASRSPTATHGVGDSEDAMSGSCVPRLIPMHSGCPGKKEKAEPSEAGAPPRLSPSPSKCRRRSRSAA